MLLSTCRARQGAEAAISHLKSPCLLVCSISDKRQDTENPPTPHGPKPVFRLQFPPFIDCNPDDLRYFLIMLFR